MATRVLRPGLDWDDSGLDLKPCWVREPDMRTIEKVCRHSLSLASDAPCTISYLGAGAFNKVYTVRSSKGKMIMRVSLPVEPGKKTLGDVATMRWLRRHTDMPVPKVFAFDASSNNAIGFEWILMEFMPGATAYSRWRRMSDTQKTTLVHRMAELQAQLWKQCLASTLFRGIGTLESHLDGDNGNEPTTLGQMVSMYFFWGDHFDYDLAKGPFRSSHDWLEAQLNIVMRDNVNAFDRAEDDDEREDVAKNKIVAERLLGLMSKVFPSIVYYPEQTVLRHDDLSLQNILVDEHGNITAVIDWECVSAVPLWAACEIPRFLEGAERQDKPERETYGDESEDGSDNGNANIPDSGLDNEGKNELYWIHLMEYEQTQLRKAYDTRMRQLLETWDTETKDSVLKQDLLSAIRMCGDGICSNQIIQWIAGIEKGVFRRLDNVISVYVSE